MSEDKRRKIRATQAESAPAPAQGGVIGSFNSDSLYNNILQGTPIHGLIASSTNQQIQMNAITHTGVMQSDGVVITIDEEAVLSVSAQTFKVMLLLLTVATEQLPQRDSITAETIDRGRVVRVSLQDYMRKCGIKDPKTAREQLNTAVMALYSISLAWEEEEWIIPEGRSRKVRTTAHHNMRITDHTITREEGTPVKKGSVEVRLSFDMAKYLAGAYIMPYPAEIYKINTQYHPYSLPLCWKLFSLYNLNYGSPARRNIVSVATLLKAAKGIPRYEVLAAKGKIFERIIAPFDRDLKELVDRGILSEYYYLDENGERVDGLASIDYAKFSSLKVWYMPAHYPDQAPRLEARQRRISATVNRNRRGS